MKRCKIIADELVSILTLLFFSHLAFADVVDGEDIRPLKGPVYIKGEFSAWLFVLILLLAAAIFGFIYFRRKRDIDQTPPEPPMPPEEIAAEELKALLEMGLVKSGLVKEYYTRLSDIMRRYIEGRYRILAMDRTTWELYQEMRARKVERGHVDKIRDFLEDCDLVKFAKYIPVEKESEEAYGTAKEIVEVTRAGIDTISQVSEK